MARVPRVAQAGAGTTPFQSFNTNADMFGAVEARQAAVAARGLNQHAEVEFQAQILQQRQDDERNLMEVEQQIRDWKYEQLQGENGVYRRRGGNALGATKGVTDGYDKFVGRILQGRSLSQGAKLKAEAYIGQTGTALTGEVARYERGERLTYDNGLREARVRGSVEEAATYYNDQNKIDESKSRIISTHRRNAEENGWSGEEAIQQIEADVSTMHKAVINRMLANKEAAAATAYLEANRKEIDGRDIADIEKAVAGSVLAVEGQAASDAIMAKDLSQADALALARADYDGKERDEVVKRVKIRYAEIASQATAATRALKKSAWDKISKGGTPDNLTPAELDAAGREVESMWTMKANRAKRGQPYADVTNMPLFSQYMGLVDADIAPVNLSSLAPHVTVGDYAKLVKRQNDAIAAIDALEKNPGQGASINRLLREFAPNNWRVGRTGRAGAKDPHKVKHNLFRDHMNSFVADRVANKKEAPTEDEMRKEAARVMLRIEGDPDGIWDTEDRAFEGTVVEFGDRDLSTTGISDDDLASFTGIPLGDVKQIIRQWPAGVPMTIDNIRKVWENQ